MQAKFIMSLHTVFGIQFGLATGTVGLGVISAEMLATVPLAGGLDDADADGSGACLANAAPGCASGLRAMISGL